MTVTSECSPNIYRSTGVGDLSVNLEQPLQEQLRQDAAPLGQGENEAAASF